MSSTFQITPRHMAAFALQQRQRFEAEMLHHLRKQFPRACARLGEPATRELIRLGIEKARSYDILLECDVGRFIELMLTLAPDFDENDAAAWARSILTRFQPASDKLDQIYERLMFQPDAASPAEAD